MSTKSQAGTWRLGRFGARRTVHVGSVGLHEVEYMPRATFPSHSHEHATLTLVLRGGFEEESDLGAGMADVCNVLVKPPGAMHANQFDPSGVRTLVVEVQDALADTWPIFFAGDGAARIEFNMRTARAMLACFREMRKGDPEQGVRGLVASLGAMDGPSSGGPSCDALGEAAARLEASPEAGEAFGQMADSLGVHRVTLSRGFRSRFGCTMSEHRRRLRVQRAARLVSGTNTTLSRIAARTGFSDQSHMTRAFSRELGVSPGVFRRLCVAG